MDLLADLLDALADMLTAIADSSRPTRIVIGTLALLGLAAIGLAVAYR